MYRDIFEVFIILDYSELKKYVVSYDSRIKKAGFSNLRPAFSFRYIGTNTFGKI